MGEKFTPSSFESHTDELAFLSELGFATNPRNNVVSSVMDAWKFAQSLHAIREKLPYGIDGVVIKIEDNTLARELEVVGKTARAWAAIKFAPTEVVTRVLDILWQVGRTGRVTPIVVLEPVLLDGSTVGRATLHNVKEVSELALHTHDMVIIRKAGDIIPEVVQLLENLREKDAVLIGIPTACPSCDTELVRSKTEVDLICPNSEYCPAQIKNRLSYFASRGIANMDGLSQKSIEKFITEFAVSDIADLYDLPYEKILEMEGFGEKAVQNLRISVQKASQLTDAKFIAGLGIDGVGGEVAKTIAQLLTKKRQGVTPEQTV